jgi:opacity protein-like surface antigen
MKGIICGTVVLVCVMAVGRADAQQPAVPDRPGFDLGVRAGYAIPFGKATGSATANLNDTLNAIPLVLEAGYRFNSAFTAGVLFQYAIGQWKENSTTGCGSNGLSCSASVVRLGAEAIYHFAPGRFAPWGGLGFGYEWLNTDLSMGSDSLKGTVRGFELLTLQAGGDFRLAPQFVLGPFLSFSIGRYEAFSLDATPGVGVTSGSGDITNTAIHEWLQFGVRGTFNL